MPTVPLTTVLQNRQVFLPDPIYSCNINVSQHELKKTVPGVPLITEPGISLIILPLMRILQHNLKRTYLIV